jgi:hypothetical protein
VWIGGIAPSFRRAQAGLWQTVIVKKSRFRVVPSRRQRKNAGGLTRLERSNSLVDLLA